MWFFLTITARVPNLFWAEITNYAQIYYLNSDCGWIFKHTWVKNRFTIIRHKSKPFFSQICHKPWHFVKHFASFCAKIPWLQRYISQWIYLQFPTMLCTKHLYTPRLIHWNIKWHKLTPKGNSGWKMKLTAVVSTNLFWRVRVKYIMTFNFVWRGMIWDTISQNQERFHQN